METFLSQTFERLLSNTDLTFKRSLYHSFELGRLTALVGPRGVGKTTLLLQYIKEQCSKDNAAFYFSADCVYFQNTTLIGFINDLYNSEGYRIFFIDEIHKYANWNQELKNLYDAFPDIKIVYSGSSAIELIKGGHDLSRRVKLYRLPGLSFREYLNYVNRSDYQTISLSTLLSNPKEINKLSTIEKLTGHFKKYLAYGYYPFSFEDKNTYYDRVLRVIDKIIFEDIPNYFDLKTHNLYLFKKILSYLASIPPGEVNTNNIAQSMQVSHQTISHYLSILSDVGLIQMVYPMDGGSRYLQKPQKLFLHNTTLLYALQQFVGESLNTGTLRELYFIQALRDANQEIFYSTVGDYRTEEVIFEIGGKNKKISQIVDAETRAILVKDDILVGSKDIIPLLFFGFLY